MNNPMQANEVATIEYKEYSDSVEGECFHLQRSLFKIYWALNYLEKSPPDLSL
jgi:hypothetical protein